jgi:hypothetical protein
LNRAPPAPKAVDPEVSSPFPTPSQRPLPRFWRQSRPKRSRRRRVEAARFGYVEVARVKLTGHVSDLIESGSAGNPRFSSTKPAVRELESLTTMMARSALGSRGLERHRPFGMAAGKRQQSEFLRLRDHEPAAPDLTEDQHGVHGSRPEKAQNSSMSASMGIITSHGRQQPDRPLKFLPSRVVIGCSQLLR